MISVETALDIIQKKTSNLKRHERIQVDKSLGRILAEDILAPIDLPPFRQSIMDGYAVHLHSDPTYSLIGEIKTGDDASFDLKPREAVRIFTGARVPDSANAVVMQERVTVDKKRIHLKENPTEGSQIRSIGAQIKKGALSLRMGFQLNPAAIGLLKSLGISDILVSEKPKVSLLVTGNELVETGFPLPEGKIYESNSSIMAAALQQKGIEAEKILTVGDTLEATVKALKYLLSISDVVLVSGGISVGDYDYVETALSNLGVTQHFYKVSQKPGKPLYFGSKGDTFVLALPGNPASTLTCLYVYGFPLIDILMGNTNVGLPRITMPLSETIENPYGRALFLKGFIQGSTVSQLHLQNSAMVLSFADANALIYIPEEDSKVSKGSYVQTILLP